MKIICTNEEKQALINSYESNTELHCCLARPFIGCASMYETCRECLEKNIEWEIKEKAKADFIALCTEQEPCADAISRESARQLLWNKPYTDPNDGLEVAEIINNLLPVNPQPKTGQWFACSDRLPEAGEYVGDVAKYYLVQNEYGDMLVARYTHSGYWEQIYQLKPISEEIVAWMPLPNPYKAETE